MTSVLLIDEIYLCGEGAGPVNKAGDLEFYNALKPVLHEIIERYWVLVEQSNSQYPSAYMDRPFAFACTLIAATKGEKDRVIAERFEDFCREKCPSIHEHLQNGWLDKWGSSEPCEAFLPFREWSARAIQSKRFFTTVKGY